MGNIDFELIYFFQRIGDNLKPLMNFFTSLGDGEFYLIIIAIIYWSWNKRTSIKLGLAVFLGSLVNTVLKISIRGPRPYWLDGNVVAGDVQHSFGMPSGHAQGSMSFAAMWASIVKKQWFWVIAILFTFMTGISRVFLGVHFPSQIVVGWIEGFIVILLINKYEKPFMAWFKQKNIGSKLLITFLSSIIGLVIIVIIRTIQADWQIPKEWIAKAVFAHEDHSLIDPLSLLGLIRDSAILFGFLVGAILLDAKFNFNAKGVIWKRVIRSIVGIILTLALWYGLGEVVKSFDNETLINILQYCRSFIFGFFITFVWPWITIKIKLAQQTK